MWENNGFLPLDMLFVLGYFCIPARKAFFNGYLTPEKFLKHAQSFTSVPLYTVETKSLQHPAKGFQAKGSKN